MGAKAKMTDHFQDNDIVDAIAFEPMRRLSAPAVVDGEHINTIENDDDEKTDGAITTLLTQQCKRRLTEKQVGEEKPMWIFLCFLLFILTLITIVIKEVTTRLGEDHWIVAVLNTTTAAIL